MELGKALGIISAPIFGTLADKLGSVKKTFMFLIIAVTAIVFVAPVFAKLVIGSFSMFAIWYILLLLIEAPGNSQIDAWSVSRCNATGIAYSHVRLWGSIGYAASSFLMTFVAENININICYYFGGAVLAVLAIVAWFQPSDKRVAKKENAVESVIEPKEKRSFGELLKNKKFMLLLMFVIGVVFASNASVSYISYLITEVGALATQNGTISAIRAFCEIIPMIISYKIIKKFSLPGTVLLVGIIYMFCMFAHLFVTNFAMICAIQAIQGIGWGLYLSSVIQYTYTLAPDGLKASAQSLVTTSLSIGRITSNLISGAVIQAFGVRTLFAVAGCVTLFVVIVYAFTLRRDRGEKAVSEQ